MIFEISFGKNDLPITIPSEDIEGVKLTDDETRVLITFRDGKMRELQFFPLEQASEKAKAAHDVFTTGILKVSATGYKDIG